MILVAWCWRMPRQPMSSSSYSTFIVLKLDWACRIKLTKLAGTANIFANRLKYSEAAIWLMGAFRVLRFCSEEAETTIFSSCCICRGQSVMMKSQTCTLWCLFTACNQLLTYAHSGLICPRRRVENEYWRDGSWFWCGLYLFKALDALLLIMLSWGWHHYLFIYRVFCVTANGGSV